MRHFAFGLVCCTLCPFLSPMFADTYSYPAAIKNPYPYGPQKETLSDEGPISHNCGIPHNFRFAAKHREANGIGYDQGYSSLDGFFLFSSIGRWYPFFDVRAHVFNNGRPAANLGLGLRYLPPTIDAVFGINGFFDFKNTSHSTFEQVGAGIEILGKKWGMRANGYIPIFSRNNTYNIGFYKFYRHHALFRANHEIAFTGFDVSLYRTLWERRKWNLAAFLDGYMFFADYATSAQGGLFKLRSELFRYFSIEGQVSYDSYFKYIGQIQIGLSIPFGKKVDVHRKDLLLPQRRALARRISEEVDRFEMIVSTKHPIDSVARDPRTGKPLHIVFVNNLGSGSGNGSAESPFTTLLSAQMHSFPGNMIYIYTGNGTSLGMNTGITLQEGQWLQGSSFSFPVGTSFGASAVPPQTSMPPTLFSAGNTVALANNTIVSGFNLNSLSGNIFGANVSQIRISDNSLRGSPSFDMTFIGASGDILLANNISYSEEGLFFHTDQDFHLVLTANDFANPGSTNMDVSLLGFAQGTVVINEANEFHDAATGSIIVAHDHSSLRCGIDSNLFTSIPDGAAYCVAIVAEDNSNVLALANENLFRSSAPGISLTSAQTATADWYVVNNTGLYTGHHDLIYPFMFSTEGSSSATLLLGGNTAVADGFLLENVSGSASFFVKSPTLNISGLEQINTGEFTTSGTITYIPFPDPSVIPVIE